MDGSQPVKTLEPLLVTGAHRSGSTWVGKMMAAGGNYAYISEPLNVWHRPGIMRAPVQHWYTYIAEENEAAYLAAFQETLALRYHLGRELRSLRSPKDIGRMLRDASIFTAGRSQQRVPLLKDPFAVFSAPWFSARLGCRILFTVRHPAAFVGSLKRLGWTFNFSHLLDQPLLMRDFLEPYRAEMMQAQENPGDLIFRASLLWRLVYSVVRQHTETHPTFIPIRHRDLSLNPIVEFGKLYQQLGVPFTTQTEARIRAATGAENPEEVSRNAIYSVNLDSKANLMNWKKRLTEEEIERIRTLTADVAAHYYTDEEW